MARYLPPDHFCPWREEAEELRERLTSLEAQVEELRRRLFGRTSERLPPVSKELRQQEADETARQAPPRPPRTSAANGRRLVPLCPRERYTTRCRQKSAPVPVAAART